MSDSCPKPLSAMPGILNRPAMCCIPGDVNRSQDRPLPFFRVRWTSRPKTIMNAAGKGLPALTLMNGVITMLRYLLPLLFICTITQSISAQSPVTDGYFRGMLGDRLAITMRLTSDQGSYRYMLYGKPIPLTQVSSDPAKIVLDEQGDRDEYDKVTGVFRGSFAADRSFIGTWSNPDGTRSLDFHLQRFADVVQQKTECARYKAQACYPQFTGDSPFTRALNARLTDIIKSAYAGSVKEMDETTKQPDPGPLPYEEADDTDVVFGDDSFVSLLSESYSYTGGAHGNTGYQAVNLLWKDNHLIELHNQDLIDPDSRAQLDAVLLKALGREKAANAKDERELKFDDLVINPTSKGLLFKFGPYEVDCYAAGTFTVMIPYRDLTKVLRADGPLSRYAQPADVHSGPQKAGVTDARD
jgi:hypothetical protein